MVRILPELDVMELTRRRWEAARHALALVEGLASQATDRVSDGGSELAGLGGETLYEDSKRLQGLLGLIVIGGICPNLLEGVKPIEASNQCDRLDALFRGRRCIFSRIPTERDLSSRRLIFVTWKMLKLIGFLNAADQLNKSWVAKLIIQKHIGVLYAAMIQIAHGPSTLASQATCPDYAISQRDRTQFKGYLDRLSLRWVQNRESPYFEGRLNVFLTIEEMFMLLQPCGPPYSKPPRWLAHGAGKLLSDLLMRDRGLTHVVRFFSNNFYEGGHEEAGFDGAQLQSIAGVILTVPSSAKGPQAYYEAVAVRLVALLRELSQAEGDRGAATLVAYTSNQLFGRAPSLAKAAIYDVVMAPFRYFWGWFADPSSLLGLEDPLVVEGDLSAALGCLRWLVLEGDATLEHMQQVVVPYLPPLFELYSAAQTWAGRGVVDSGVEAVLLKYFSYFADPSLAISGLLAILTSGVAVGPVPVEFRPANKGFCIRKRSRTLVDACFAVHKPYALDLDAFVGLVIKLDKAGSVPELEFMTTLLEELNLTTDPLLTALQLQALAQLVKHCGDHLMGQPPASCWCFSQTSSREACGLLSVVIEVFEGVLDANHPTLEREGWAKLQPLAPIIKDLCGAKSLPVKVVRRCHAIKLLLALSPESLTLEPTGASEPGAPVGVSKLLGQAKLLYQDPLVPIRASAMQLLGDAASKPLREGGCSSIVGEMFSLLMEGIEEAESYVYLAAIKALAKLAINANVGSLLLERYLDFGASLELRLRVGEALLQAVHLSPAYASLEGGPMIAAFMLALQGPESPFKGSALSLISSIFERAPMAAVPYIRLSLNEVGKVLRIECDPAILRPAVMLIYSILDGLGTEITSVVSWATLDRIRSHLRVAIHRTSSLDLMATRHAQEACNLVDDILRESLRLDASPAIGFVSVKGSLRVPEPMPSSLLPDAKLDAKSDPSTVPPTLRLDPASCGQVPDLELAARLARLEP
ncbi:Transport and Golgi organization protein 6 [Massospora cicadina]|nr:Transport and Golgi organization protein 6 [Massospora cicadina]